MDLNSVAMNFKRAFNTFFVAIGLAQEKSLVSFSTSMVQPVGIVNDKASLTFNYAVDGTGIQLNTTELDLKFKLDSGVTYSLEKSSMKWIIRQYDGTLTVDIKFVWGTAGKPAGTINLDVTASLDNPISLSLQLR